MDGGLHNDFVACYYLFLLRITNNDKINKHIEIKDGVESVFVVERREL